MKHQTYIINASDILTDDVVAAKIPAFQKQYDEHFLPPWADHGAIELVLNFMGFKDFIANGPAKIGDAMSFYLNRHSVDPGDLGWHTQEGKKIYGRVFVGDCMRYGIDWGTDLTHELLETGADPEATRSYQMPDGRYAALEVCDAVEADAQAYIVDGVLVSNFVLPTYFSKLVGAKYDYGGHLTEPCPSLTPGGYMSILQNNKWQQVSKERTDGLLGRRAMRPAGWRRTTRNRVGPPIMLFDELFDAGEE